MPEYKEDDEDDDEVGHCVRRTLVHDVRLPLNSATACADCADSASTLDNETLCSMNKSRQPNQSRRLPSAMMKMMKMSRTMMKTTSRKMRAKTRRTRTWLVLHSGGSDPRRVTQVNSWCCNQAARNWRFR